MLLLVTDYEDYLLELAKEAENIKVLIAFLTKGGLNWLPKERIKNTEFIVGIDLGITSPIAVKYLQENNSDILLFNEHGKMFHPKALYFKTKNEEYLIIGSNNLTSQGISSNHELSLSITKNNCNQKVFTDFLAHFNYLKNHNKSGVPDNEFFAHYKQSSISQRLNKLILKQRNIPLAKPQKTFKNYPEKIDSLSDFIILISNEFPNLDRSQDKTDLKSHPLKLLNDENFRPMFKQIISDASNDRLKAESNLNIGGKWYRIPNILAKNEDIEPWNRSKEIGRLVFQIHFSNDYKEVFFSVVLQYNIEKTLKSGEMPSKVKARYEKLYRHAQDYAEKAVYGIPQFHHWNYKSYSLWGKPIISFQYKIDSLPDNQTLLENIESLTKFVNASSTIL